MAEKDDEDTRYKLDDMKLDAADAFVTAERYHGELKDIYRYFMPWRLPVSERSQAGDKTEGSNTGNAGIYDSTGTSAAASFAANMQADWLPHFEPLFKLEAGPLASGDGVDALNKQLEVITKIVHSLLGDVRVNALPMLQDLFAGTGAMFMEAGEADNKPVRGVAVPILETAMTLGPWDDVERVFWKRKYKLRHLEQHWPDAKIDDTLAAAIRNDRKGDVEVMQYTYWDAKEKAWRLCSWTVTGKTVLARKRYKTRPWITPRMLCVPGEGFGRGPGHLALPTAKTLNKSQELGLRAAAFALLGIWLRRHDGVFNPRTAVMKPGAMWKVAHVAGNMKTIERLDAPKNFDISSFVAQELRDQLRRVTFDDDLPDLQDKVRSPTEIAARLRRYDRNRGGNTVRLGHEMILPLASRATEICQSLGLLGGVNLKLDQIGTQVTVLSPAAVAARSGKTERLVSWLQMIIGLFGPQAALLVAEVEKAIPEMARWMGVDEAHIRTAGGTKDLKDRIAQYAAALQQSDQAKATQAEAQTVPQVSQEAGYTRGMM